MYTPFQPYMLAGIPLRNHFVRSATVSPFSKNGRIQSEGVEWYRRLAAQEIGLIITEMTYISPEGQASLTQPGISSEEEAKLHNQLVSAVHAAGGKIFIQLNHGGAASLCDLPVSPSGIPSPYTNKPTRAMTQEEIAEVVNQFSAAAMLAKKAGYDGIQIHCAHGYLLSQFISPFYNQRKDCYGGCIENRFRFPKEVIAAVKNAVGDAFPVCIKINSNAETDDDTYEDELMWMGRECARSGVCAIEVSGYDFTPQGRSGKHTYYLERAKRLHQSSGLPIMLVGGIRTFADAQRTLEAGIDLISMSRPFFCQPDLIPQLKQGHDSKCVSCSKCFFMLRKFSEEGRLCIQHEPGSDRMLSPHSK